MTRIAMEHLNYCRQLARHCSDLLAIPSLDKGLRMIASGVLDLYGASTKFLLPAGGRLFDDFEYRGLDETVPLRLPYKYIAIEYQSSGREFGPDEPRGYLEGVPVFEKPSDVSAPKRVVFVREREENIVLTIAFWTRHDGTWRVLPECALPVTGYLDRDATKIGGRVAIRARFQLPPDVPGNPPYSDYSDEIGAVLCFLNVLQCSNVQVERSEPKKAGKKIKSALPFDTYHYLTIDAPGHAPGVGAATGGHRSPRGHLRRGHIRRLCDGRRIWVNAAVINAGIGGKVSKDYRLRAG